MHRNDVDYPPLVDCITAYQNGLLDAVTDRVSLIHVLSMAEEYVLFNSYRWGYEKGGNLKNEEDVWQFFL